MESACLKRPRLAILDPIIQRAGVSVDRGLFQMLVAVNRKVFGFLPSLYGADFPAEMGGNLFPGNEFLLRKG
jgi:hypothetical protein